ncbi:DUF3822 family protein [Mangrovimonas aestuarii]|uniref:DUF3822 family protein n=1 Tax=Mangrovimonas aestuarii TaxID=3018443 RepID=UPI002379E098|nr:DUF3822 family protein [Mangrovimonas aestuarii]
MALTSKKPSKLTNQELSIQISLSGLSFCILQKDTLTVTYLKHFKKEQKCNPIELLDWIKEAFDNEEELSQLFRKVQLIHSNELASLVPDKFFDEAHLADYLKYNAKILVSDYISYDTIDINRSKNVYVPYVNVNNFIYDQFGEFTFKHSATILIENVLKQEQQTIESVMYINVDHPHFEIVVIKSGELQFYNRFEFTTKEDFIYYVLFTVEQLELNPETVKVKLVGSINENDELYNMVYKYIREVNFGKNTHNLNFTKSPKNNHSNFIILNSF